MNELFTGISSTKGILAGLTSLISLITTFILSSSFFEALRILSLVIVFVIILLYFIWRLSETTETRRHRQSMEELDKKNAHEENMLRIPKKPR